MTKQWTGLLAIVWFAMGGLLAQTPDNRTLFSVEDKPVTVDEFTYIYGKTNGEEADYSAASLEEYLGLYVNFKLKVHRAKEMRLDTITSLRDELAGYRRQLADSYLIDKAIGDKLVQEAYAHLQQDVDISHVFVALSPNATPADTLAAFRKISDAKAAITKKNTFEMVAQQVSEDKSSKDKGGRIGYVTALFPNGLHALEYAAYTVPTGKVSGPIRTVAGYHLLMVHDRRPARGEVEAAHILVRTDDKDEAIAKARIDSIYQALQKGAAFDELARTASEDRRTALNAGYIGYFGISRYEKPLEDAAFGLTKDNTYCAPVKSSLGWHIVKRISRKEIQPFVAEKPRLEAKVKQDGRFEDAKASLLRNIRTENHFTENTILLNEFIASLPDTFTTFRWKAPAPASPKVVFSLDGGYQVTLGEYADYMDKATRQRVTYSREADKETVARKLYAEFVDDQLMKYEEAQLEKRYPEFRSLMREYEEGILLFEATKMEVWDKAAQDTVGLERFYAAAPGKYRWASRAKLTTFRIANNYASEAAAIRAYAATHTAQEVKTQFNTAELAKVTTEETTVEQGRNPDLAAINWAAGAMTEAVEHPKNKSLSFIKIEEIMPESDKTLAEARGYVIADYQDYLEKQWVQNLRKSYKVVMNDQVFKSLVK